jgi:hypothetical protein
VYFFWISNDLKHLAKELTTMKLVNETQQQVTYTISCASSTECGNIDVDGLVDLPYYDNQSNVVVAFTPADGDSYFRINVDSTGTGKQVEMALVAE